jgi:predicted DNA-binding protein (MmcQ/YjbR family)
MYLFAELKLFIRLHINNCELIYTFIRTYDFINTANHNLIYTLKTRINKNITLMNIEQLRKFCLSLPHTTEDIKWDNDLCFLIGEKMFCVTGLEGSFSASFKVKDVEFNRLTEMEGIIPAPYLARNKWVLVENSNALTIKEWSHYISQSYATIKSKLPKKILAQLDNS